MPRDSNSGVGPGEGVPNKLMNCPGNYVTKMICGPTLRNADLRTGDKGLMYMVFLRAL